MPSIVKAPGPPRSARAMTAACTRLTVSGLAMPPVEKLDVASRLVLNGGMTTTQTWLITGASSGLGLALTKQALAAGHHVVATTRKEALPVKDPRLTVARLDPADREGCRH